MVILESQKSVNIIYWGGKLLALWEAAQPHRLDPFSLETIGLEDWEGVLQNGDAFSAHPWINPCCELDQGQPCLVNFSLKTGISSQITLFEFNPKGQLLRITHYAVIVIKFQNLPLSMILRLRLITQFFCRIKLTLILCPICSV
jgi:all-trans-8'-apo-beta-carotenal 15,15'-oxygenase